MADGEAGGKVGSYTGSRQLRAPVQLPRWVTQQTSEQYWRWAQSIPDEYFVPAKVDAVKIERGDILQRNTLRRYAFELWFETPTGYLPITVFRDSFVDLIPENVMPWILNEAKWTLICAALGIQGDHP